MNGQIDWDEDMELTRRQRVVDSVIDVVLILLVVLAMILVLSASYGTRSRREPPQIQGTGTEQMILFDINADGSETYVGTDGRVTTRPAVLDETQIVDTFHDRAGFAQSRLHHQSLIVDYAPVFTAGIGEQTTEERVAWLQPMLDSWNRAAGWDVFVQREVDTLYEDMSVFFHNDADIICPLAAACVTVTVEQNGWSAGGWFLRCDVHFWTWYPTGDIVMHELGHCLGFFDVPEPELDGYFGIMSYGRQWGANVENAQDRNSLIAAGYAE